MWKISRFENIKYLIFGKLLQADGTEYPSDSNVEMTDHSGAHAFTFFVWSKICLSNRKQFKDSRTVFVINLTRQAKNISESKHNLVLHVNFHKGILQNTVYYVCLVSTTKLEYDINKNHNTVSWIEIILYYYIIDHKIDVIIQYNENHQ